MMASDVDVYCTLCRAKQLRRYVGDGQKFMGALGAEADAGEVAAGDLVGRKWLAVFVC